MGLYRAQALRGGDYRRAAGRVGLGRRETCSVNDSPSIVPRSEESARIRWPLRSGPSAAELRELAFEGHADDVRAAFECLLDHDREHAAEPDILRQACVGSRNRLARLGVTQTQELDAERRFLESVVRLFADEYRNRLPRPRTLFQTLLEWVTDLRTLARLAEAEATCELAVELGVDAFPDLAPWIDIEKARVQILLGRMDAAHTVLARAWRRRDLIGDRHAAVAVLDLLATTALETGRGDLYHHLLLERLRSFHTNTDERRHAVRLMRRSYRGTRRLLTARRVPVRDRILWLLHAGLLGAAERTPVRSAGRGLEHCSKGLAYVDRYVLPAKPPVSAAARDPHTRSRSAGRSHTTLVTRAMGGIGDFLMMTPGLHELARVDGRVTLAIPRRYFSIFDYNADVALLDIHDDLEPESFDTWFNLTDCPAARIESRTAPDVRANRIELFARGLGIGGARLRTMDRRPRYTVVEAEARWCHAYLEDLLGSRRVDGSLPLIGVQPHTDEAYRDLPHMPAVIDALAAQARVVVFSGRLDDARAPRAAASSRVRHARGLTWRQSAAIAASCHFIVSPDSAFFHLAAALERPCLGLFGPTDGRVRAVDYPLARVIDARATLPCVPCWRNDRTPCGLTGRRSSACLRQIDPRVVAQTAMEMLGRAYAEGRTAQ